jgi:hypothetical protein
MLFQSTQINNGDHIYLHGFVHWQGNDISFFIFAVTSLLISVMNELTVGLEDCGKSSFSRNQQVQLSISVNKVYREVVLSQEQFLQ